MSESKHTPWPLWEVDWSRMVVMTDDGRDVAALEVVAKSAEDIEANAHIIAAAPELLAELEHAEWEGLGVGNDQTRPACPRCLNDKQDGHEPGCTLAAALAKARGAGKVG
jgi:hypothetical protein